MAGNGKWLAAAVVVLLGVAPAARAQEIATSFDQLRVLVKPGDSVTVTDAAGHETKGKIRSLSSSSLELSVGEMPRVFGESVVRTVSHHRHASLGTGAKWGFFIGAGLGALGGAGVASEYSGGEAVGWVLGGAAMYGGLGAATGVGVAALIRGPHLIYAGRPTSSSQLTVSPVLLAGRKGVAVSLEF
jgi:hypothetical protein